MGHRSGGESETMYLFYNFLFNLNPDVLSRGRSTPVWAMFICQYPKIFVFVRCINYIDSICFISTSHQLDLICYASICARQDYCRIFY